MSVSSDSSMSETEQVISFSQQGSGLGNIIAGKPSSKISPLLFKRKQRQP